MRDDRERRETGHEIRDLTPIDREEILREHRLLSEEERLDIIRKNGIYADGASDLYFNDNQTPKEIVMQFECKSLANKQLAETLEKCNNEQPIAAESKEKGSPLSDERVEESEIMAPIERDEFITDWERRTHTVQDAASNGLEIACDKDLIPEEIRRLYFEEKLSQENIAKLYGYRSAGPIKRIFTEQGWELRDYKLSLDDEDLKEAHRLYYEEKLTLRQVAEHFGVKTHRPIVRIFREQGWQPRAGSPRKIEIDQEEVQRLYYGEKLSISEIARQMNLRSSSPLHRLFKEQGWEKRTPEHRPARYSPEEVHRLYFEENLSQTEIAEYFGYKTTGPIHRLFKEHGWEIRSGRSSMTEDELKEVHQLYFEEEMSLSEIADIFECPTSKIHRIFREKGWNARDASPRKLLLDPDEVHRLYFESELSQCEIARFLKCSEGAIRRVFREQGWTARPSSTPLIDIKPEEVHHMYFSKGLSMKEVAESLGYRTAAPIRRIFAEQGWEPREPPNSIEDINAEEVYKLYFKENLSMHDIAGLLGSSMKVIRRVFIEQGWPARPNGRQIIKLNPEEIHTLYYDEGMTQREIASHFGFDSAEPIRNIFLDMGWIPRRFYESEEERDLAQRERRREEIETIHRLREQLFGSKCGICGSKKKAIHKKDGKRHSQKLLWTVKGLESLDPDDWVALCRPCHRAVHALMKVGSLEWDRIFVFLRKISRMKSDE